MDSTEKIIRDALPPERLIASYNQKFPYLKRLPPNGADVGHFQFRPSSRYMQRFYDDIYHQTLTPLSHIPLKNMLDFDLTTLLPDPDAPDYPEQCLGLVNILDQQRGLMTGYGNRYMKEFFDPIAEKLARQLTSQPIDIRPDGKAAWMSRGYSFDDWLIRMLWIYAPLIHSDSHMVKERQVVKDWLHNIRSEVESHTGEKDPFAKLEADDDINLKVFESLLVEGSPTKSYSGSDKPAAISDYAFWWIRILNAHFAITDYCGRYPFWVRWRGLELTEKDQHFLDGAKVLTYSPEDEPLLQKIRQDYLEGKWEPLQPNPEYEGKGLSNKKALGERGHGPVVHPQQ